MPPLNRAFRLCCLFFLCLLFAVAASPARPSLPGGDRQVPPAVVGGLFEVGEELVYNVSYASFDIGQVRVKIIEKVDHAGKISYKAKAFIDSYKGVPFVDLHFTYESLIDELLFSTWFREIDKTHPQKESYIYNFDYSAKSVYVERRANDSIRVGNADTVKIDTMYQDGLSLFYFARAMIQERGARNTPTFVKAKPENTYFNFRRESVEEEIDAVDYPVDVIHFDGKAEFVGIFGLTGEFEGWFSNDDARIPILAKMKVLLGNVRIELMRWTRSGWNPPRYSKKGIK